MELFLDLHFRAGVLELLLHRLGIGLGHGLLHRRGRALDQVLGLLEAKPGDLADHLDDGHLLVRRVFLQSDGELGLLLDRGGRRGGPARSGRDGHRGRGGHAELLLHVGNEFHDLEKRHLGNCIEDFVFADSHVSLQKVVIGPLCAGGLLLVAQRGEGAREL